jgi:Polyketide cyclase / dehydrase and lipid transport
VRTAEAEAHVVLAPEEAADLWRDTRRWSAFVEGFQRFVEVSPDWPANGSTAVWESIPRGRGRVTEKVVDSGDRRFATRVAEERLLGTQRAVFQPADDGGAVVRVELEYELTTEAPLKAVADVIFIRRALRDALRRTLRRFAIEAEEERGLR